MKRTRSPGVRGRRKRGAAAVGVLCALLLSSCTLPGSADDGDGSRPEPAPRNGAYHPDPGLPYRTANSRAGILAAAEAGHGWIDIDSHQCTDLATGRPVAIATHWPVVATEFEDLLVPLPPDLRWPDFPCARLGDLRGRAPHPQAVHRMTTMVRWVAQTGNLSIEWEIKPGSPAFRKPAIYRPVLRLAAKLDVQILVKTLDKLGHERALDIMRAAKKAGARTMLLNTGRPSLGLTAEEQSHLDYVRGDWHTA